MQSARVVEALGHGVVPGSPGEARAAEDSAGVELPAVLRARVPASAIGGVHGFGLEIPSLKGPGESLEGDLLDWPSRRKVSVSHSPGELPTPNSSIRSVRVTVLALGAGERR